MGPLDIIEKKEKTPKSTLKINYDTRPEDLKNKPQSEWTPEDWERVDQGMSGYTPAPWDIPIAAAGAWPLMSGAVKKWGLDKTAEVGVNALFPDAPDILLEQLMRDKQLGLAASVHKGIRLSTAKAKEMLIDVFDGRVPNPLKAPELFETGVGIGPRSGDVRITNRDIQGPVTNPNTPIESWLGKDPLTSEGKIQLAESVYLDSLQESDRLKQITNYKLRGSESFEKWAREEYVPLMNAAANEAGMGVEPFYSLISSKPGFKYIEHRIAKRADLRWYWERFAGGDPNIPWDVKANEVNNLRLLLDDRFKKLKDVVEFQIYGDSKGLGGINNTIANNADKYIVDIQSPTQGSRFIGLNQNAGDVVIKRAGTGEEVGRIGEYYNVLFSSHTDLMQKLPLKFPQLKTMSLSKRKEWIRNWRKGILQDHLAIIRNREKTLIGLTDAEKALKIDQALFDDMVDFREEYKGILPFMTKGEMALLRKNMSAAEIDNFRRSGRPITKVEPDWKVRLQEKRKRKGPYADYTKTLESQTTKIKGTGRLTKSDLQNITDDIIDKRIDKPNE